LENLTGKVLKLHHRWGVGTGRTSRVVLIVEFTLFPHIPTKRI